MPWLVLGSAGGSQAMASVIFGLGMFLLDFSAMTFFINYLTLRQTVAPDHLLGRVTAMMMALSVSLAPLGGLAGGWVAEHWGLRAPIARMRELETARPPVQNESVAEELPGTSRLQLAGPN